MYFQEADFASVEEQCLITRAVYRKHGSPLQVVSLGIDWTLLFRYDIEEIN